jgi:hypothetical protein
MKKAENEKGYLISYGIAVLLTVVFFGIFFTGNDGIALTSNMISQDYQCTYTAYQYGEVDEIGTNCVRLSPSYLSLSYPTYLDDGWFNCILYPATGSKNLLGTASTAYGWAGCSVERRGRSLTVKLSYIKEDEGYVDIIKCLPCNGCCTP